MEVEGAHPESVGATSAAPPHINVNDGVKKSHNTPTKHAATRRRPKRRVSMSDTVFKPDRSGSELEDHMVTKPRTRAKSETPRKATPTARTKKTSPSSTGKSKKTRGSKANTTPSKSSTRAKKFEKRKSTSVDADELTSTPVPKRTKVGGLEKITPPESGTRQNGHSIMFQDGSSSGENAHIGSIPGTPLSTYSSGHRQSSAPHDAPAMAHESAKATAAAAMSIVDAPTNGTPSTPVGQQHGVASSPKASGSRGKSSNSSKKQTELRSKTPTLKKGKRLESESSWNEYEADEEGEDDDDKKEEEVAAIDLSEDPILDESRNPPENARRGSYERYRPEKEEESPTVLEPKPESVFRDADVDALRRMGQDRLAKRRQQREKEFADLTEQEYSLFEKLDHRGYESFVPVAWHLDFPFGLGFYYGDTPKDTHISAVEFHDGNANFRAMNALRALLKVGPVVRDRHLYSNLRPEPFLRNQFQAYHRWANTDARDGKFDAPNLLSIAFDDSEDGLASIDDILSKLEHRMLKNVQTWREWHKWHTSPEVINEYRSRVKETAQRDAMRAAYEEAKRVAHEDPMDSDDEEPQSLLSSEAEDLVGDMTLSDLPSSVQPPQTPKKGWFASLKDKLLGHGVSVTPEHGHLGHQHEDAGKTEAPLRDRRSRGIAKSPLRNFMPFVETPKEEEHDEYTGPIDAVYGIAVMHLVVVILSLPINNLGEDEDEDEDGNGDRESRSPVDETSEKKKTSRRRARVLFYLDFSVPAEDVWNSVAVAMTVCHCRDLQLEAVRRVHPDYTPADGAKGDDDRGSLLGAS